MIGWSDVEKKFHWPIFARKSNRLLNALNLVISLYGVLVWVVWVVWATKIEFRIK